MKSANPENEYIPLDLRISVRRDTLSLSQKWLKIWELALMKFLVFLAEDSVIDLELLENFKLKSPANVALKI